MKIAIDISPVVYGTGVSTYTKELVVNLLKIDKKNHYILFGGSLRRKQELWDYINTLRGTNFTGKVFTFPPSVADLMWNRLGMPPVETFIGEIDILHSSDWTEPPTRAKKITTIHDLTPILYPDWTHEKIEKVHKRKLKLTKKQVDHIIVPSETTKKDLVKLGFKQKISVIPEASTSALTRVSEKEVESVKQKYNLSNLYMISVGVHPRKNTIRIVRAYKRLKKTYKNLNLVLVGTAVDVDTSSLPGVIFTGFISDKELSALYSGASTLLFPSLYEGFGIPILDAMKLGIPVVTSNLGSMKEVAGDAAVQVDPKSVDSIVNGVKKAFSDSENFVKKGIVREKKFSWEKMAMETLKVYDAV